MKNIILIFLLISYNLCFSQNFKLPENYTIVREINGDLDKDGNDEVVLVCNTDQTLNQEDNFKRVLYILKKKDNSLTLLKKSSKILWGSKDRGFCCGEDHDPLINIEIKNNTLIIEQETYNNCRRTEKRKQIFRFQDNDWYLIGSTYRYWDTCDFDDTYDINFSTNEIILKRFTEICDDNNPEYGKKTKSVKKYKYNFPKVTLDNYKPTEIKFNEKVYFYY